MQYNEQWRDKQRTAYHEISCIVFALLYCKHGKDGHKQHDECQKARLFCFSICYNKTWLPHWQITGELETFFQGSHKIVSPFPCIFYSNDLVVMDRMICNFPQQVGTLTSVIFSLTLNQGCTQNSGWMGLWTLFISHFFLW